MGRPAVLLAVGLLLAACGRGGLVATADRQAAGTASAAATQVCQPVDESAEEVLDRVWVAWDSSFLCANAADVGSYEFTVRVRNATRSTQAVRVEELVLTHTSPRPRGTAPRATATAAGLPLVVEPGASGSFTVNGTYELVSTDEGKKANLHLQVRGRGVGSGELFALGVNAQFRAPGVAP